MTKVNHPFRPSKIISGGQTVADIGGLVGARRLGIATGGTAPKGYRTEKGPQPEHLKDFGLVESSSGHYQQRTKANIEAADATLIVSTAPDSDGTRLTIDLCLELHKPHLLIHPDSPNSIDQIRLFIESEQPAILNVAGNRESKSPGIARKTAALIQKALSN